MGARHLREIGSDRDRSGSYLPKTIGPIPSVMKEDRGPRTPDAQIIRVSQRFMNASYLYGPCPLRGPPEASARKRVIMDLNSNELLADDQYEAGAPMSELRGEEVYREIADAPRNIIAHIWD